MVDYFDWPPVPALLPTSFPGIKTGLDTLLVDVDRERLERRMQQYFNPKISHAQLRHRLPEAFKTTKQFDGEATRTLLLWRGFQPERLVRYCYRPFDLRWLYWEPEGELLAHSRPDYTRQLFENNPWLELRRKSAGNGFDRGYITHSLAGSYGRGTSRFFPLYLSFDPKQLSLFRQNEHPRLEPNLSPLAADYLADLNLSPPYLFYHVVAILHTPRYRQEHAEALSQDWPRLPLPAKPAWLKRSAALGQQIAKLLAPEAPVPEVTTGPIRADLKLIAPLTRRAEDRVDPKRELALSAAWSQASRGNTLPEELLFEREYTEAEWAALQKGAAALGISLDQLDRQWGPTTYDIYLNEALCWANLPSPVWHYTVSGYPVLKKWLAARAEPALERPLKPAEAQTLTEIARRITAIVLLGAALDANYRAMKP